MVRELYQPTLTALSLSLQHPRDVLPPSRSPILGPPDALSTGGHRSEALWRVIFFTHSDDQFRLSEAMICALALSEISVWPRTSIRSFTLPANSASVSPLTLERIGGVVGDLTSSTCSLRRYSVGTPSPRLRSSVQVPDHLLSSGTGGRFDKATDSKLSRQARKLIPTVRLAFLATLKPVRHHSRQYFELLPQSQGTCLYRGFLVRGSQRLLPPS